MRKNLNKGLLAKLFLAGSIAFLPIFNKVKAEDELRIYNYASGDVAGSLMEIHHKTGSLEGFDDFDVPWSAIPPSENSFQWLKIGTFPESLDLIIDSRSSQSTTIFEARLSGQDELGFGGVRVANRIRFEQGNLPLENNRIYLARITRKAEHNVGGQGYTNVVNIREVLNQDIVLPDVADGWQNNDVLGEVKVISDFLKTNMSVGIKVIFQNGTNYTNLGWFGQCGVNYSVQTTTNLLNPNWTNVLSGIEVPLTSSNFNLSNIPLQVNVPLIDLVDRAYFRLSYKIKGSNQQEFSKRLITDSSNVNFEIPKSTIQRRKYYENNTLLNTYFKKLE